MAKSCFNGYLTDECEACEYWRDGTIPGKGIGCGCPFPIMQCEAFARMLEEEEVEN